MFTRRIATAAVLLAIFGASCAGHSTTLAAGAGASSVAPATPASVSTSTTAATATTVATLPPDTTPAHADAAPVVTQKPKAAPAPATIEVDYQPQNGDTATATIDGPGGQRSRSLASGSALFGGLAAGTYTITISVESPPVAASDGTGIGTARQITNGESVHVEAGEHGVITCNDNGCSGAL